MPENIPQSLTIRLKSAPFMDDPEDADTFYAAYGRAMLLWGRFESHLDDLLLTLCNMEPARQYRPKELPVTIKKKKELLKSLLHNVPEFQPFQKPVFDLFPQIADSIQDRHALVHGHWNGFVKGEKLTGQFIHQKHKGGKLLIYRYDVTVEMLESAARTFDSLNTGLMPITWNACVLSNRLGPRKFPPPGASRKARRSPANRKRA